MTVDLAQRSEAWHQARLGKVTASRVADVVARIKTGWGASRANYAADLIAERLTGQPAEKYSSPAMQWGTDTEEQVRAAYAFASDVDVWPVGFVPHPGIAMAGASPDGLVGEDGLLELKCPNTATHIDTLLKGVVAEKYLKQVQWQMACTGRAWVDFASFDPRMPDDLQLWVRRIPRDDEMIAELEREVIVFLAEIDETVARLTSLYRRAA